MTGRDDLDGCAVAGGGVATRDRDIPWSVLFADILGQRLAPPIQRRALEVRALEWRALFPRRPAP